MPANLAMVEIREGIQGSQTEPTQLYCVKRFANFLPIRIYTEARPYKKIVNASDCCVENRKSGINEAKSKNVEVFRKLGFTVQTCSSETNIFKLNVYVF